MTTLWQAFARNPAVDTLGWALLNFVWQGTLLVFVLRCLLAVLGRHTAAFRYWTASMTLVLMALIPVGTLCKPRTSPAPVVPPVAAANPPASRPALIEATRPDEGDVPPLAAAALAPADARAKPDDPDGWIRDIQTWLPAALPAWMSAFWILGVAILAVRTCGGLVQASRLRRDGRPLAVDGELANLIQRSGVAFPVQVLESDRVFVPTVVGWLHPSVLLPEGSAIETAPVRALLAHELAHVRRRDYFLNIVQAAIEIALFYHPAAWWTSTQVRTERECCCDDAAVATCGDLRTYVRALSDAEQRLSASKLAVALGGTPLLHRIRRLTDMKAIQHRSLTVWATATAVVALVLACSLTSTLFAFVPAHAAGIATQSPPQSVTNVPKRAAPATTPAVVGLPAAAPAPVAQPSPRPTPVVQQSAPLTIAGTIVDPTGDAVVPGAVISIVDAETKQTLAETMSKVNGAFAISVPKPNVYLQVSLPGFETQVLKASQVVAPVKIQMQLCAVEEVATVTTDAPAVPGGQPGTRPIRVGGNVASPKLLTRVDPVYPPEARDAGVEGTVVVLALIDKDGTVRNATALSGPTLLRDAAVACVSQWQYRPGRVNGEPWPLRLTTTVVFTLRRDW